MAEEPIRDALRDGLAAARRQLGLDGDTLLPVPPIVDAIGQWVVDRGRNLGHLLDFLGRTLLALGRIASGRRRLGRDFLLPLQEASIGTLPVVALIAFASGAVLTVLATQQLDKIAGISLLAPRVVAIVILRELAALVTGLALAGRLGPSYAAELATLVAVEDGPRLDESEAVHERLVAPRVLAPILMGPLLVTYASALGLLGGMFVGVTLMDFQPLDHVQITQAALDLEHGIAGLLKGAAFGLVVGVTGCYHGLHAGQGRGAVGQAVKAASVSSMVAVVLTDTLMTLFFRWVEL